MDVSTKTVKKVGKWASLSGPATVGIVTDFTGTVDLQATKTKDDGTGFTEICKVKIASNVTIQHNNT